MYPFHNYTTKILNQNKYSYVDLALPNKTKNLTKSSKPLAIIQSTLFGNGVVFFTCALFRVWAWHLYVGGKNLK